MANLMSSNRAYVEHPYILYLKVVAVAQVGWNLPTVVRRLRVRALKHLASCCRLARGKAGILHCTPTLHRVRF